MSIGSTEYIPPRGKILAGRTLCTGPAQSEHFWNTSDFSRLQRFNLKLGPLGSDVTRMGQTRSEGHGTSTDCAEAGQGYYLIGRSHTAVPQNRTITLKGLYRWPPALSSSKSDTLIDLTGPPLFGLMGVDSPTPSHHPRNLQSGTLPRGHHGRPQGSFQLCLAPDVLLIGPPFLLSI